MPPDCVESTETIARRNIDYFVVETSQNIILGPWARMDVGYCSSRVETLAAIYSFRMTNLLMSYSARSRQSSQSLRLHVFGTSSIELASHTLVRISGPNLSQYALAGLRSVRMTAGREPGAEN